MPRLVAHHRIPTRISNLGPDLLTAITFLQVCQRTPPVLWPPHVNYNPNKPALAYIRTAINHSFLFESIYWNHLAIPLRHPVKIEDDLYRFFAFLPERLFGPERL